MAIFGDWKGDIGVAAGLLLQRAEDLGLLWSGGRWSIADLDLDAHDARAMALFLSKAHHNLEPSCQIDWYLARPRPTKEDIRPLSWKAQKYAEITHEEAIGLLLLAAFTEHGRRHAYPGQLWPFFQDNLLPMDAHTRSLLFAPAGGCLSAICSSAITAATRRFRLREVTHDTDRQRWFCTVFLQFGLPAGGFEEQLPRWLEGQGVPTPLKMLLSDESENAAPQLKKCWQLLQDFRRGRKTRSQVENELTGSSWFRTADIGRWLQAAQRPGPARAASIEQDDEPEDETSEPLIEVWLEWSAGLGFRGKVLPLSTTRFPQARYSLLVDGKEVAFLLPQGNQLEPVGATSFKIPFRETIQVQLCACDDGEPTGAEQQIYLWKEDAVAVFDHSGRPVEGEVIPAGKLLLSAPAGATCEGQVNQLTRAQREYFALEANSQASVWLDGQQIWSRHGVKPAPRPRAAPSVAALLVRKPDEGFREVAPHEQIDLDVLYRSAIKVLLPATFSGEAWLMAGYQPPIPAPRRACVKPVGRGWGEPLRVAPLRDGKNAQTLAASIVNRGLLSHVSLDQGVARLTLTQSLLLQDDHFLVVWPHQGPPTIRRLRQAPPGPGLPGDQDPSSSTETTESVWEADVPPDVRAVALAFRNHRIGAWWSDSWSADLDSLSLDHEAAVQSFLLLSWLQLPLLAPDHKDTIRRLVEAHLPAAIQAWCCHHAFDQPPALKLDSQVDIPVKKDEHLQQFLRGFFLDPVAFKRAWKELDRRLYAGILQPPKSTTPLVVFGKAPGLASSHYPSPLVVFGKALGLASSHYPSLACEQQSDRDRAGWSIQLCAAHLGLQLTSVSWPAKNKRSSLMRCRPELVAAWNSLKQSAIRGLGISPPRIRGQANPLDELLEQLLAGSTSEAITAALHDRDFGKLAAATLLERLLTHSP